MQILKRIPYYGSLVLLAYMPFHVFLSQSLSLLTGGLDAWKIGKDLLLFILAAFTICLVFWQGRASRIFKLLTIASVSYAALHFMLWWLHPELYERTAALGTIYNVRVPLFAVIGAGAVALLPKFAFSSVMKWVLGTSTVVAFLGILQYFLPNDLLVHVGYSIERGVLPSFAIDSNPSFPRIMSTLREPNALGAYLIVPSLALILLVCKATERPKRLIFGGCLGLHLLALALTQSRSAWLAFAVSVVIALLWQYRAWFVGFIKKFWYVWIALLIALGSSALLIKDTHFFQAYIIHTSEARTSELDSNELHWLFAKRGLEGMVEQPLGHGPGTAGLVSIQNPGGSFLTENYFIQLGYEVGIFGLALFIAVNVWLYRLIWRRKDIWSVVLLSSFWAYVITNMFLHTWSNEAVAAQWWILAGMAAASVTVFRPVRPAAPPTRR